MKFKYKILLIITPLVFILDQLTKWLIRVELPLGHSIPVIPGIFDIVHVTNEGAAFGMFSSSADAFRNPFFYIVAFVAVVIIAVTYLRLTDKDKLLALIFSLILGGIAGNICDRLKFGEVTDFLSFHIYDKVADFSVFGKSISFRWEWPAFNVADSAITVAMILLIWSLIKPQKKGIARG